MITLYDDDEPIGVVEYTDNLDTWNGSNSQCGGVGLHMGIGKLKNGGFYLCHGSQRQGSNDYAETIDKDIAKSMVLRYNPDIYEDIFGWKPDILSI